MTLKEQNVLFFSRTMGLGGTEKVILQLCEIFQPLVNKIVVCSCGGVNVGKLNEMGIVHYHIADIENKNLATVLGVGKDLLDIVKRERITVIHTHHRMAAFYVRMLGLYKKCFFMNTSHNTFTNRRFLTKIAYRRANLIACGEMVKKNLVEVFSLPEQQIKVIHNAVKPFTEYVKTDELLMQYRQQGKFLIGNVGRLSEQKGMEYFIRAIPLILQSASEAMFFIVGTGEDEAMLKDLARDLHVTDKLVFLGYRNDIQNLMSQLDLVVLSSLWEGFPLTPIEAYSVGRTIVATAVDGTVEIVRDGTDGCLIEPRNPEAIAQSVVDLLRDSEKRKKYEIAAKERFQDAFSYDALAENYRNYYQGLVR